METNDIKKALYKEKPIAYLSSISKTESLYYTHIGIFPEIKCIWFLIPNDDLGDAVFLPEMEAKFMIRWIQK
jgi:hypothetical protein